MTEISSKPPGRRAFWLGFAAGIAPALVLLSAFAVDYSHAKGPDSWTLVSVALGLYLLSLVMPVVGIILCCIKRTRMAGLGVLIGSGIGLIAVFAICGGTLR